MEVRKKTAAFDDREPEVLVVGAGQAGLTIAARLGAADVDTLVVDPMQRVGDNWRKRYRSLILHNETCTNHLPYMPFPSTWPVYIPKDELADWFEAYAASMELNGWTGTSLAKASFDETERRWTVHLTTAAGMERVVRPAHLVLATGVSGSPNLVQLPGQDRFSGSVVHSSQVDSEQDVTDLSAIVLGAGNSAHDIAQDLFLRGARVVMVQRSSTTVVSIEPSSVRAYELYRRNEDVMLLEDIDLLAASVPFDIVRQLHGPLSRSMADDDKVLLDKLRTVGFKLDNGEDDTGYFMKLLRRLGGYYLNVGASDLIADGSIGLRSGVDVAQLTEDEVVFSDGTRLRADMVVLATGYRPLQDTVSRLFGSDVVARVGPIWGLGPEGELRNMWCRTGQPGFYVAGGTIVMCRTYSKLLALLIKARLDGLAAA